MQRTEQDLYHFWSSFSQMNRWLTILWNTGAFTDQELDYLVRLDENFLVTARDAEHKWREWVRANVPKTEKEWLEIFPEGKAIVLEKIQEYRRRRKQLVEIVKRKLEVIGRIQDEFERWCWRETIKNGDIAEIVWIDRNLMRLSNTQNSPKSRKQTGWIGKEEIKFARSVPIETILDQPLRRSGRTLSGICPLHEDRTPSFVVYPETNSFYCFGCNESGDVIKLTKLLYSLTFVEAVKRLLKKV